jgi:formaldehyde-activating enzyme involved in methanogenesis
VTKLDEKYKVRDMVVTRATALNNTYKITDKIYYAANQMQTAANRALETAPGQQASKLLSQAANRAIDTVNESRKLAVSIIYLHRKITHHTCQY